LYSGAVSSLGIESRSQHLLTIGANHSSRVLLPLKVLDRCHLRPHSTTEAPSTRVHPGVLLPVPAHLGSWSFPLGMSKCRENRRPQTMLFRRIKRRHLLTQRRACCVLIAEVHLHVQSQKSHIGTRRNTRVTADLKNTLRSTASPNFFKTSA
jgi:hypothetical protein